MEIWQLVERFRRDIDDVPDIDSGPDYEDLMIPNEDAFAFLNEAQEQFAELTQIFVDSRTREIVDTRVKSGDSFVTLDSRILLINYAYLVSRNQPLCVEPFLDAVQHPAGDDYGHTTGASWLTATGIPNIMVPDVDAHEARLLPQPTENDVIRMTVVRYPLCEITEGADERALEVKRSRYQRALLDYMKARAYGRQDVDIFNLDLEREYDARFEAECADIKAELYKRRKKHGQVRYGGTPIGS